MRYGRLASFFAGISVKRLSAVDAEKTRSNQHEVGTTRKMRDDFLGTSHKENFPTTYIWLGDGQRVLAEDSWSTHYDARFNNQKRGPEWRLYYFPNSVTEAMQEGDTLFLARNQGGRLWFIVTASGSTSEQQLFWLFGIHPEGSSFLSREIRGDEPQLDFAGRFILEQLGIEIEESDTARLDKIIEPFGRNFPTTSQFSQLARSTLPEVIAQDDPDAALIAWLDHEEALFRRLERRIVSSRIEQGFLTKEGIDVDGFVSFSLSVQNRRKSRMGHSLENHIAAVLKAFDIPHERGAITEHNHKPDFLFPSASAYQSAFPGTTQLGMLGAKSTCKDRWRQVLAEAAKIPQKHLLTLEPSISEQQTSQMQSSLLQLVVPSEIQKTYTGSQQAWLWSFRKFIDHARILYRPMI